MSNEATEHAAGQQPWWGPVDLEVGRTKRWRIGPCTLWVQRLPGEWRVAHCGAEDPIDTTVEVNVATADGTVDPDATAHRFAIGGESGSITILPRTADRAVVSRPDSPFHVPPGEKVVLFVGSPLWVSVSTEDPKHTVLDIPAVRPSDTWFGPTTKEGELCYASKTYCRLRVEDVPMRPHRCVTAVTILNRSEEDLSLERMKLPVNSLALYAGDDGRVWTQDVTLESRGAGDYAEFTVSKAPPATASKPQILASARREREDNVVLRAFGTLFE